MSWLSRLRRGHRPSPAEPTGPAVERARRFAVRVPVRYRCRGEREWQEGVTENLSCTGLLFRARQPVAPRTPVELSFALPAQLAGPAQVRISCDGYVARVARGNGGDVPLLAAALLGYRVLYADDRPETELHRALQEEAARQFALGLAREFNDQLAVIVGNSELILAHPGLPDQLLRSVERSKTAALHAASLIDQLLGGIPRRDPN